MSRDIPSQDTTAILERGILLFRGGASYRREAEAARRKGHVRPAQLILGRAQGDFVWGLNGHRNIDFQNGWATHPIAARTPRSSKPSIRRFCAAASTTSTCSAACFQEGRGALSPSIWGRVSYACLSVLISMGLAACGGSTSGIATRESTAAESGQGAPLTVQTDSAYVTDQSRWGRLIFDPERVHAKGGTSNDVHAIARVIGDYHRSWLSRDSAKIEELLDPAIVRVRDGQVGIGLAEVGPLIASESRGERPEGFAGSTELSVRDVRIRIDGHTATAFYRVDIQSGARWEFADLATIYQAFVKRDGRWTLLHHVESFMLVDENAPLLPDDVPNMRTPFVLDFVYPVKDLKRAIDFYTPFLGEPEMVTAERASFRLLDSRFELEAKPFDERITIIDGAGNGYGIINVPDLAAVGTLLTAAGASRIDAPKPCGPDLCIVAEDPSTNVVVWRENVASVATSLVHPTLSLTASDHRASPPELREVFEAWMKTDPDGVVRHLADDAQWIDESMGGHALGISVGHKAIRDSLSARWTMLDRGPDGLEGDMQIREIRTRAFGRRRIVTFNADLRRRGAHPTLERAFVSQVWSDFEGENKLESSFITSRYDVSDQPVSSMDYTTYPLHDLGRAGRFYKTVLGSEPYRDENWFGFWSTTGVFGMLEAALETTPFRPYPHRNNGYADLSIRSAKEVLHLLQLRGAELPHVFGINSQAGIDPNPGYDQILAIDSEGNLINFSEYLEY